jgi:hypothetical protein
MKKPKTIYDRRAANWAPSCDKEIAERYAKAWAPPTPREVDALVLKYAIETIADAIADAVIRRLESK